MWSYKKDPLGSIAASIHSKASVVSLQWEDAGAQSILSGGPGQREAVDRPEAGQNASAAAMNGLVCAPGNGSNGTGQIGPFSSSLSNVRLYSRPLSDVDVAAIHERPRL